MSNMIAAIGLVGLTLPTHAADKGTVLVIGAGRTGAPLAKILLDEGYKVRVLMRNTNKPSELPAAAERVQADVTKPETLPAALKGADYVISTVGATGGETPEEVAFKGVANLAQAAKAAKVKQFVLMSSTFAGASDPVVRISSTDTFPQGKYGMVLMWEGKGEEALRASGVPYTIVRPGHLSICEPGKAGLKVANPEGLVGEHSCRADIALVMAATLNNKDALGKTIGVVTDSKAQPGAWKADFAKVKKDNGKPVGP